MDKKVISTLEMKDIRPGRISGNSIRQVDFAIDMLYQGHTVKIEDHFAGGQNSKSNRYLFDRVIKRLEIEHNLRHLFATDRIKLDKGKLEIQFL